jgi:hypothetical protein
MARGGRKTPPNNHFLVVMCSRSETNITIETTTTSNDNLDIPIEPVTPLPQGIDVQEIFCQTLIRTQSALYHIRQPGRHFNQPLDLKNIQEQFQGIGLPRSIVGTDNITNPAEALILGAGGSGTPPSPPGSSPPSSRGESLDEGSYSYEPSEPSNQNNPARP